MLTRFEKRDDHAREIAEAMLNEYFDFESAEDRILSRCNGQRWLARLVEREMRYLSGNQRKAA